MTADHPTVSRLNFRVVLISVGAALGGFLFGFDTSVINGAVDALNDEFNITNTAMQGFAVSSALLGCAIGAWFAGSLANKMGRIPVMVIAAFLFFSSSILTGLAPNVPLFIAWRILGGLGVGAASVIAPAYIAEVSPARVRGRLGSLQQLAIVLGIFAALLSDTLLTNIAGSASDTLWWGLEAWRWMFFVTAIPALVYGLAAWGLPESPRYLVHKGDYDKASRVLHDFSGELDVNFKIQEIEKTLDKEKKESLRDLRGDRFGLKPIVWVGILLSVFQQFVGINVIFYYSSSLWQSVGFDESDALLESVITSITNIVVTIVAILLVDKVGRRIMLLVGSAGMGVCLSTMAIAFSQATAPPGGGDPTLDGAWGTIALVAANGFVVFFGATWGPLVWVLLGEMFPNKIRASALAVAAAAQWLANFFISTTFPKFADIGLTFAYGFYAFFAILSFFFVFWQVPETKGRELEDMTEDFSVRRRKDTAPA
ncbi:sugar porter family MFS transporter [Luteimicrobium subarcticum]|uniref:Sugar porter (SP) family MFS transporter n=1 Tax=Luteimicrobium subarcticum TaxID=620910 RepID=A0A2M8WS40_9MICO|nr:sugar porter family MFS transporter [Luteimicrobium subarcticum]PJI93728.1 sugar porter (SP) family MFS transporter [Luteimicrobium subarcticum]